MRPALPVSRLEIRRDGAMRRTAIGAGSDRLSRQNQTAVVSVGGTGRRAVDLYGAGGTPAGIARIRIRPNAAGKTLRVQTVAVLQLVAGAGGRHRFQSRLLAASRRAAFRSADDRLARQPIQHGRSGAGVRSGGPAGGPVHRGGPGRWAWLALLAHHTVVHAGFHDDPAARATPDPWPFLDPHRR